MIYEKFQKSKKNRVVKSQIGITKDVFNFLLVFFKEAYDIIQKERLDCGEIKRLPRGGNKGYIPDIDIKLFFIFVLLKKL